MPRKKTVTAASVQDWRPSEKQVRHGRMVFAARLCKQGKYEAAKNYCTKMGLPYPPFSDGVLPPVAPPPSVEPLVAGPQAEKPTVEAGQTDGGPATSMLAGEAHATQGELAGAAAQPAVETGSPAAPVSWADVQQVIDELGLSSRPESAPVPPLRPGVKRAVVEGFCLNKRLLRIKLEDGEQASMWKDRQAYRLGEEVEVLLERGTPGINALYVETMKPC